MTEDLSRGSESESGADAVATEAAANSASQGELLSGAAGAETLIGQAAGATAVPVEAPAAGAVVPIPVQAGQRYAIEFDPSSAQIRVAGDDLVLTFANGGQIVFQGIGAIDPAQESPIFEIAGTDVPAAVLYQQAVALAGPAATPEGAPTLETAAGPDAGPAGTQGTGETRYSDDTGQIIPLLDKQGVIPGVELQFGLITLENLTPLEELEEALLPPVARDDVDMVQESCRQGEYNEGEFIFGFNVTTGNVLTGVDSDAPPSDGMLQSDSPGSNPPIKIISVSSDLETKTTADADGSGNVTLHTSLGGTLEINLISGFYTYTAPPGSLDHSEGTPSDLFTYTIQNLAGLTDSATLTILIKDTVPFANADTDMVVEGGAATTGNVLTGVDPDAAPNDGAQAADTPSADSPLSIVSVSSDTETKGTADADGGGNVMLATSLGGTLVINLATGAYTYTPPASVDNSGGNPTDQFTYTIADSDGSTSSTTLTIEIKDTAPAANADTDMVVEGGAATTGNVLTGVDPDGAPNDGAQVADTGADTPLSIVSVSSDTETKGTADADGGGNVTLATGLGGTLVINLATGAYTYTPPASVDNSGGNPTDIFTYTIADSDGSMSSTTLTIEVKDTAPVANADTDMVVEGGAATTGNVLTGVDPDAAPNDGAQAADTPSADSPLSIVSVSSDTETKGTADADGGGNVMLATSLGGTLVINLATGAYTYTPPASVDNSGGNPTDQFTYTIADSDGSTSSTTLTIEIKDSVPVAEPDTNGGPEVGDTNLILIFDRSGSMDDNPNVNGFSDRIDLARAAVANLLNAVGPDGNLNIMIVDFAGTASTSGWLTTVAQANAYLASLDPSGTTNYNAAIDLAMTAFDPGMGAPTSGNNITYFLSDGKPNPASTGLDAGEQLAWENFLTANDMPAYAVGIGTGANAANLAPIAYDPTNTVDPQIPPILVTNESNLISVLLNTTGNNFNGNVLANDTPGADGYGPAAIVQLQFNSASGFVGGFSVVDSSAGGVFRLTGSIGLVAYWVLTLDETTGDYQLDLLRPLPHPVEGGIGDLVFDYTIEDGDGSQASTTLTFNITDVPGAGVGLPLIVDATPDNADALVGTDADEILAGDHGNDELSGGGGNDHLYGGNGNDILDGGDGDDILIGGQGNDELYGDAGDDVLNGGSGNDLLDGGEGNDTLYGGAGNDDLLGFDGDDDLFGDNGNDYLFGEDGDDFVNGGAGNDNLFGGDGNDILFGGGGDDFLDGGLGDDDLYGSDYLGLPGDVVTFYYYGADEGHDYIIGFDNTGGSQDIIDLRDVFVGTGGEFLDFTQLLTQGYLILDSGSDVAGSVGVNDTVISIDLDGSVGAGSPVMLATVLDTTLTSSDNANFMV